MASIFDIKFKEEKNVIDFVSYVINSLDFVVFPEDVDEIKLINEELSIANGADPAWFDYENPANYEDDGTYFYCAELNFSKKMVYDIERDVTLLDGSFQSTIDAGRKPFATKEYLDKLFELEIQCKEFCEEEGIDYVQIVLDESAKKFAEDENDRLWREEE